MVEAQAKRSPKAKVFVVDDDPIILQAIEDWLTEAGYAVFTREQALGTASWVAAEKPDYVILDVSMPAMKGGDLAQLLRGNHNTSTAAIILLSAMNAARLSDLARESGAIGAIHKSSTGRAFVAQFEHIAALHRARSTKLRISST